MVAMGVSTKDEGFQEPQTFGGGWDFLLILLKWFFCYIQQIRNSLITDEPLVAFTILVESINLQKRSFHMG